MMTERKIFFSEWKTKSPGGTGTAQFMMAEEDLLVQPPWSYQKGDQMKNHDLTAMHSKP